MSSFGKQLRKRLESVADSEAVTGTTAKLLASRLRRLHDTTRWEYHGRDELAALVGSGQPVIMALWHGRLAMSVGGWDPGWGPFCVVTSSARPGRMVGRVMQKFGLDTMPMRDRKSNTAASLQVARMVRNGTTIGFAVDGPLGPARQASSVPIDWSRLTKAPIWLYSNSFERHRTLPGWDRMALPKPGGRGVMLYRPWGHSVPKRLNADTRETLRCQLQSDLDALGAEADRLMGHDQAMN